MIQISIRDSPFTPNDDDNKEHDAGDPREWGPDTPNGGCRRGWPSDRGNDNGDGGGKDGNGDGGNKTKDGDGDGNGGNGGTGNGTNSTNSSDTNATEDDGFIAGKPAAVYDPYGKMSKKDLRKLKKRIFGTGFTAGEVVWVPGRHNRGYRDPDVDGVDTDEMEDLLDEAYDYYSDNVDMLPTVKCSGNGRN